MGKTSLAESMAKRLERTHLSTDSLARHPGRPWPNAVRSFVPEDVADHYLSLTVEELIMDVMRHYRGMWPGIKTPITENAADLVTDRLILEGSALWP